MKGGTGIFYIWPSSWATNNISCPVLPVALPAFTPLQGIHEGHLINWFTSGFE